MVKKFGDLETALTDFLNSNEFLTSVFEYFAPYMEQNEENKNYFN